MDKTTDLKTAQEALVNIYRILDAIKAGSDSMEVFREIGRAMGTATVGLIMSGHREAK